MRGVAKRARIAVVLLLAVHAGLLFYSSRVNFVTADEPGYFAAAITHWKYGELDLYRVNPPLVRMISIVPVLPFHVDEDTSHWRPELAAARDERRVGRDFAIANGSGYLDLIRIARLSTIVWSVLGGCLIFVWSRRLFGDWGGLLSLALWCFEPNVLGHGSLMTPDVAASVTGLAAMFAFDNLLARPSQRRVLICGALLGVAVLAKFTNLYLIVAWAVLYFVARRPLGWRQLAVVAAVALVVVNLGYGFKRTLHPLGSLDFKSDVLKGDDLSPTGNRFMGTIVGWLPIPLPGDFVQGLDVQHHDFDHRFKSYLHGEWRDHGWWYYYVYALAIKVPLGTIALVLVALAWIARQRASLVLVVPIALVLLLVSSQIGINSHLRYVLPIFPFVMIACGKLATVRHKAARVAVGVALLASVTSSLRVYPHSLSYFNELVGPDHGDEYLVDSNIDWGQDALALRDWIEQHAPREELGLAYFGGADPRILGLRYTLPPRHDPRFAGQPSNELIDMIGPHPGLFAVSVNFQRGLEFEAPDGTGTFQPVDTTDFTYFKLFRPIATAGYSIRIYCVTTDDANAARRTLGLPALATGVTWNVHCDDRR